MKKLLITGANGFIGKNLIEHLYKKYKIICLVYDNKFNYKDLDIVNIDFSDIDENKLNENFKNLDYVIHLAAVLDPYDKNIRKVNVGATKNLVELANKNKIKKFIFLSTENILHKNKDLYTKTKIEAENIVKKFRNYIILRSTLVYGKYDNKYISSLIKFIKKSPIIIMPGKGDKLMQPIYVKDLVKCIENCLKYDIKGTYLVAGGSKVTYNQIINLILQELNLKKIKIHFPMPLLKILIKIYEMISKKPSIRLSQLENLDKNRIYNIETSKKILKYKPLNIEEGIKDLIKNKNTKF